MRRWLTNTDDAPGTVRRIERGNPEFRGRLVQGEPEPTVDMTKTELKLEKMVGIYLKEPNRTI